MGKATRERIHLAFLLHTLHNGFSIHRMEY